MANFIKEVKGTPSSGPALKKAAPSGVDPAAPVGAMPVPAQGGELHPVNAGDVIRKVRATKVVANPRNPRRKYHKLSELAESIAMKGQLQPIKAAERAAYLAIFPEDASKVGESVELVANLGNRRLCAVQLAGDLDTIEVVVDNSCASSRLQWATSATSENTDREQLSTMDLVMAYAEQAQEYNTQNGGGGQKFVADTYKISEATVSNYLKLTHLIPELQDLLDSPDQKRLFPMSAAVKVAQMFPEEQQQATAKIMALPEDDQFKAWKTLVNGVKKRSKAAPAKPEAAPEHDEVRPTQGPVERNRSLPATKSAAVTALDALSIPEVVAVLAERFEAPELEQIGEMLLNHLTAPASSTPSEDEHTDSPS